MNIYSYIVVVMEFLNNLFDVMLEALPFLAFGFFISGLLRSFVPSNFIVKHLGKENWVSPIKAAFFGAPIPLCSCSVIPVTMEMRRGGAGKGSISSFLISAPETGFDSLSISYAMLGPLITVARLISALITAIFTGWAIAFGTRDTMMPKLETANNSCCASEQDVKCCDSKKPLKTNILKRFIEGQKYSFTTILNDSFKFVMIALIITALIKTVVPQGIFTQYGDGFLAMLVMVIIGFPMYICASASTPVAVSLLLLGVSPGAALAFMLAGPASNIATIGVVSKMMGKKASFIYLISVCGFSIGAGMIFNELLAIYDWKIDYNQSAHSIIPMPIAIFLTALVLFFALLPSIKKLMFKNSKN